jgi:hypothetical protein
MQSHFWGGFDHVIGNSRQNFERVISFTLLIAECHRINGGDVDCEQRGEGGNNTWSAVCQKHALDCLAMVTVSNRTSASLPSHNNQQGPPKTTPDSTIRSP